MTLAEAERRLRENSNHEIANTIRDHLAVCGKHDGCVSAEKVRELLKKWDESTSFGYQMFVDDVRAILPPEPTALDRAIAMVEGFPREANLVHVRDSEDLLALLRRAKEEGAGK